MNIRILIVEDESIVQLDLQSRVRRLGHTVVGVASAGEEAVAKAALLSPDLILMDVCLEGEMDGIEAARRIRSAQTIPIVYVTAYTDAVDGGSPLAPRLSKPFRTPELRDIIEQAVAASQIRADS